jgi:hypothetical protein
MSASITVEVRAVGGRRPLFPDFSFDLEDAGNETTLRQLIARVVLSEVEAFRNRQESRRLMQVLTQVDIAQGLMKGKVVSGGSDFEQSVDKEAAIANAIQAFEDGVYYIFVDDHQKTELDASFRLGANSRLTFLRLVPLAGG